MLKTIARKLLMVIMPIVLLIILVMPELGMVANIDKVKEYPFISSIVIALWVILMAVNLPLTKSMFTWASSLALIAVILVVNLLWVPMEYSTTTIIIGCIDLGLVIGWITISSHFWRWYRGITPTDDPDTNDE